MNFEIPETALEEIRHLFRVDFLSGPKGSLPRRSIAVPEISFSDQIPESWTTAARKLGIQAPLQDNWFDLTESQSVKLPIEFPSEFYQNIDNINSISNVSKTAEILAQEVGAIVEAKTIPFAWVDDFLNSERMVDLKKHFPNVYAGIISKNNKVPRIIEDAKINAKIMLLSRVFNAGTSSLGGQLFDAYYSGGLPCGWNGRFPEGNLIVFWPYTELPKSTD